MRLSRSGVRTLSILVFGSALLVAAGCGPRGISVVGVGAPVVANDGYELTAFLLQDENAERGAASSAGPRAIVGYIQGSDLTRSITDSIGTFAGFCAMNAPVVVVERRGVSRAGEFNLEEALHGATKSRRAADHAAVVSWALERFPPDTPLILLGASEGADVAARVAAEQPRVTHVVLLGGGGGWTQADEFRHFIRSRGEYMGMQSEAELDAKLADIRAKADSGEEWLGLPYRRWNSFMFERAAHDLLRLDCPILVVHGARDNAVPVESARALRDEFARAGRTNLTYLELPGADHTFVDAETGVSMLPLVELEVLRFAAVHGLLAERERKSLDARVRRNHPELFR